MVTSFGVPNQIITRGTASAPSRRPSMAPKEKIEHTIRMMAPLGYVQNRGGWSSQGGFRGMQFRVKDPPKSIYESPLSGTGEPTLIPSNSLRAKPKGVIRLPQEEYEKIKMTPHSKHPIFDIGNIDALSLYQ